MTIFRCSSLGKLMTEPKSKTEVLSAGAKTYIKQLVAQELFGIDFHVSTKPMQKGVLCESEAIIMLNSLRNVYPFKNQERKTNDYITGEADIFDPETKRGHDIKCSWSAATFPITTEDAVDKLYEWQMRGYMMLWDCDVWEVNYCLLDTPEELIGYEPREMHIVSHIPERMRLTTWVIERDKEKEQAIIDKVQQASNYYREVLSQFDHEHEVLQKLQQVNETCARLLKAKQ
jgi:hypothetical protein